MWDSSGPLIMLACLIIYVCLHIYFTDRLDQSRSGLPNYLCVYILYRPSTIASPSPAVMNTKTSTDVLDMPVDPNEPTYCLCHQVSFGEMIGCDNIDVSMCRK